MNNTRLHLAALLVMTACGGPAAAADTLREVFSGFNTPDAARTWSPAGEGAACKDVAPTPPGRNRFCAEEVRFEKGSVILSGEVAKLGAVGAAITLRPGPGIAGAKLFPSEGTFAAKIRTPNLNQIPGRYTSVKAFFTYAAAEQGQAHFENDFEIISEANAFSRDMLAPFGVKARPPLMTTVTHVSKDGADHLNGGAAPLGPGRAPAAILVVQNRCIEGCAERQARVYESVYSMALEGRGMKEIGRTTSKHQPGGYDDLAVMFNLWWLRGAELQPARQGRVRQELEVLWFAWQRNASVSAAGIAARGEACYAGKEKCPFESFDRAAP